MKNLSLITSMLILSSSVTLAQSTNIKDAFANGTANGEITLFYQGQDNKSPKPNFGTTLGLAELNYKTDTLNGFDASMGFIAYHKFDELTEGDFARKYANKATMTIANIKYENEDFYVAVGRQKLNFEWLKYFNEAIIAQTTIIPNTEISVGYSNRNAEIVYDKAEAFTRWTKDGIYVINVETNVGFDGIKLNPYYYNMPDALSIYGFKAVYNNNLFGFTGHYAISDVDVSGIQEVDILNEDGSILNIEARVYLDDLNLAVGYISTDKNGGADSMAIYGDKVSPFEEGDKTYAVNADTWYVAFEYDFNSNLGLYGIYGQTDWTDNGVDKDDGELNLGLTYSFTKELSTEIIYVNYEENSSADDYNKILANLTYSF